MSESLTETIFRYSANESWYLPKDFKIKENKKTGLPIQNVVYTSGKDGVLLSGISIGEAFAEDGRIKVKLFTDP